MAAGVLAGGWGPWPGQRLREAQVDGMKARGGDTGGGLGGPPSNHSAGCALPKGAQPGRQVGAEMQPPLSCPACPPTARHGAVITERGDFS